MSSDPTGNLQSGDRLDQLISLVQGIDRRLERVETRIDDLDARMGTLETRMGDLETKFDQRLKETRPIWEAVQSQLQAMDGRLKNVEIGLSKLSDDLSSGLRKVERKIEFLNESILNMGGIQRDLLHRVEDLESKAS